VSSKTKFYNPNKVWVGSKSSISGKSSSTTRAKTKKNGNKVNFIPWILNHFKKNTKSQASDSTIEAVLTEKGTTSKAQEYKIFKPSSTELVKENIKARVVPGSKKNAFSFGFKSPQEIRGTLEDFSIQNIVRQFQWQLARFQVFERFNKLMLICSLIITGLFLTYLCFFDTFFLVKTYSVTFAEGSYISKQDMEKIIQEVKRDKFLGFIPNNQLWFLNGQNLTAAARNADPEIVSMQVQKRNWPNGAEIKVTTKPILLTLGINGNEYWRISQTGEVLSLDDAGLRENLVIVDRKVAFNKVGVSLQDYSFNNDCDFNLVKNQVLPGDKCKQLNRFWFTIWVWENLDSLGIKYNKTVYPSLFDTDVQVYTTSGTKLLFDSQILTKETQKDRLVKLFESNLKDKEAKGEIAYIDFRIPRKIFVCERGKECEK
jgi:hypothetical protein